MLIYLTIFEIFIAQRDGSRRREKVEYMDDEKRRFNRQNNFSDGKEGCRVKSQSFETDFSNNKLAV